MRRLRKALLIFVLSLLLLLMGGGELNLSPVELAAAPYRYDLLAWEFLNVPDKWSHKLWSILPWNSRSREEKIAELQDYFRIGDEIRTIERHLAEPRFPASRESGSLDLGVAAPQGRENVLLERLDELQDRRSRINARVEETLESEVSAVLSEEGFRSRVGLIFPPVDVALSNPPKVLVLSPRDRIERTKSLLLKPSMEVADMEALEAKLLDEQDLAALVVDIGGVATYPTIVRNDASLRHAAITAAHEWLHTYWFFRPLGWNMFGSSEMNILNETAASLAGRELGSRVYQAITGEVAAEEASELEASDRSNGPAVPGGVEEDEEGFDFDREMRRTRLRVEELLGEGEVEQAESYMEQRRLLFVENGFHIRKLNQAYFAFHGTYGASPASVSPIGGEVEQLLSATDSLGDFIRTMAGFGSVRGFRDYLSSLPKGERYEPPGRPRATSARYTPILIFPIEGRETGRCQRGPYTSYGSSAASFTLTLRGPPSRSSPGSMPSMAWSTKLLRARSSSLFAA